MICLPGDAILDFYYATVFVEHQSNRLLQVLLDFNIEKSTQKTKIIFYSNFYNIGPWLYPVYMLTFGIGFNYFVRKLNSK